MSDYDLLLDSPELVEEYPKARAKQQPAKLSREQENQVIAAQKAIALAQCPKSTLVKHQRFEKQWSYRGNDKTRIRGWFTVEVRYDDQCGNGHNSFAITGHGKIRMPGERYAGEIGGCCHDLIAKLFPKLEPYFKWHLCSSDGPMHYVENTTWLAGDRDCWDNAPGDPLKSEFKLLGRNGNEINVFSKRQAADSALAALEADGLKGAFVQPVILEKAKGKNRELGSAREAAIWPEATDEDLMQDRLDLALDLCTRLPALLEEFKDAMESLGFTY